MGILFLPLEFMVILPHIGVIFVLALAGVFGRKAGMPASLGVHYERE
jgi:hypothetical protein